MAGKRGGRREGAGGVSKYDPKYCDDLIKFFSREPYREVPEIITYKDGTTKEIIKKVANDLPFISAFARTIGFNRTTVHRWEKDNPEFADAMRTAKDLQEEFLVTNALHDNYAQPFSIFTAKNILGWRDKSEVEVNPSDEMVNLLKAARLRAANA